MATDIVYDVCVIGGGVIGCAVARELSKYSLETVLIEKEPDVAEGTSKANSGVLHAGFNVAPGSLKAKFNVEGLEYFPRLCYDLGIAYKLCKKLVIAKNDEQKFVLNRLFEQGLKNKCRGLSIIQEQDIRNIEPLIEGKYALYSEKTAVITPYEFTIALAENALMNGCRILLNTEVLQIRKEDHFFMTTNRGVVRSRMIINAAGLYSDEVLSMMENHSGRIYPCRGEYFVLDSDASEYLKTAVYPVPNPDGSGLGVHLTPTINGNILIGPSAEFIEKKTDLNNTQQLMEQLKNEAFELMPLLRNTTIIKSFSGNRPKLFTKNAETIFEDFIIKDSVQNPGFISLIGIESPGLTSAPAIAKYVVENMVGDKLQLKEDPEFNPLRQGNVRFKDLAKEEKKSLIARDRNYGEIMCRCEMITKGEILCALNNPLGVKTLNAVKKRTHSMMGRCQSGFCLPRIIDLLDEEFKLSPERIVKNDASSYVVVGYGK